jgi:UDP-glucose 4-epimerase
MNVLVVGGAGYIGSHAVRLLDRGGHVAWVYDNCSLGHPAAVPDGRLIRGDLRDAETLAEVLRVKKIDAVMHFAAFASVPESVAEPAKYYDNNVIGTLRLLEAMRQTNVTRIVFSSTCATYGIPDNSPISEETPQRPINPYGFTKLTMEQALEAYAQAYGFGYAAFRYFNASGASPDGDIGEDHDPETHLIPIILQVAQGKRPNISIYGDDYPTPDRTCIRDYIHVDDLADAHIRALDKLQSGQGIRLNLGTGHGNSVREVIEACRQVTGHEIPTIVADRRAGDPPELVADNQQALKRLDWKPDYTDIRTIVETAWRWHHSRPHGYGD